MAFRIFTVPIQDAGSAQEELNAFLRGHKVLSVERRWVEQGSSSFWTFCVDYLESASGGGGPAAGGGYRGRQGKVDYKEVLKPEEFAVFARLRDARKSIAQAEGLPVYAVFTNEQLAEMVRQRAASKADLEKVAGVGDARVGKFGDRVLAVLAAAWANGDEKGG